MDFLKAAEDSAAVGLTWGLRMSARFVFLGPPGAGKGTQAVFVSEKLAIPAIATGAIFRAAMSKETTMGKEVAQFVNSGLLVPDQLTNAVVAERLKEKDCRKGFILDGYPPSLVQAKSLDSFLQKSKTPLDATLYFNVDAEVVISRMGQRRICSQCGATYNLISRPTQVEGKCDKCGGGVTMRSDDQPDSIRKRLEVYQKSTEPLLQYYGKKSVLKVLNASSSVQDVAKEVAQICIGK
jgi:adenylate kinase